MKLTSPVGMQLTQAIKDQLEVTILLGSQNRTFVPSAFTKDYIQAIKYDSVVFYDFANILLIKFRNV